MKVLNKKSDKIFRDILSLIPENEYHIKLGEDGNAIMPLCVENIGEVLMGELAGKVYSFTHYFQSEGDSCCDPEMTFAVFDHCIIPMSFEMQGTVLARYEVSVKQENGKFTGYFPKLQKDHTTFANQWMQNLKMQHDIKPEVKETTKTVSDGTDIKLVDYSDRAFALFGEGTRQYKDQLLKLGKFNRFLKHEGNTVPGFIFSKNRMTDIKQLLSL